MTSARWLNLVLWGLGDRLDGVADTKSNLLLLVNLLIWIDALAYLVQGGVTLFVELYLLGPLLGHPAIWLGTQLIVGWILTRGWPKQRKKNVQAATSPQAQSGPVVAGPSEEP
ncbi:MAG: hypothetical protein OK456_07105 [Thaumarchaeota archaeon]|nr:hypothetical protein [Nitrososphaerota archaeon]